MKIKTIFHFSLLVIVLFIVSTCSYDKFEPDNTATNEIMKETDIFDWKFEVSNTKFTNKEKTMFFLDKQNGWIGDGNTLYKTFDSGKTWEKVNTSITQEEFITKVYFSDLSNGWLAIQKHEKPTANFTDREFRILTTKDSGSSWQDFFTEKDGSFTSWKFDGQGHIWIAGVKYIKSSPICFEPLFLNFEIKSVDVVNLAEVIFKDKKRNNVGCLNEAVMGVDITEDKLVKIITSSREIYQENKNAEWSLTNKFNNTFSEPSIKVFQASSPLLWFISSKGGIEGTEGNLTLLRRDSSFDNQTKNGYYFSDAIHISNDEFVISGFKVGLKPNKNSGTILTTNDGGKNFIEIFQNSNEEDISCMFKFDENNIWALGKNGSLIKLYRDNK